jgi:TPR repeat protein
MRRAPLLSWALAGLLATLAGCSEEAPSPVPGPSSAPATSSAAASAPSVTKPSSAGVLARQATPTERRVADEVACTNGHVEGCRAVAERYRGYGAVAGCGVPRASDSPRLKRIAEDSAADRLALTEWLGKACDLGDAEACELEDMARRAFRVSTRAAEDTRLYSSPSGSALWSLQKLLRPQYFVLLEEARRSCLKEPNGWMCGGVDTQLYARADEARRRVLGDGIVAEAQAICERTRECTDVLFSLDENGYGAEVVSPVRARAAEVLTAACLAGDCTCGEAARYAPEGTPNRRALAELGCENGEAEGCYELGKLHEEGQSVPKDETRARALFELACPAMVPRSEWRAGPRRGEYSARACDRLAELYEGGEMPPKDPTRARFYAQLACSRPGFEREHAPCVRLARYWASSKVHTGRNAQEAESYFYGTGSAPIYGKECRRPSVKELCAQHEQAIIAVQN